jgi:hypothetical protein
MADPHILSTLRTKRDEIERTIDAYQTRLKAAHLDLAHVNATLHLFEVNGERQEFPLPMSIARMFKRGEIFRYCQAALADAPGGLDTRELALVVIQAKGLNEVDAVLRKAIATSVISVLGMRAKRGQIAKSGKRKGIVLWRGTT